jgi:7,8-dihydropterin-6-yl-methyl-4-(beta-D-ribofuranosyl)aminobenzene 5'-phosphate synthase
MKITVLIADDGPDDMKRELGLSLHVEHRDHRILFDTGASGGFADNAAALGIDLSMVDAAVISHQHFDHVGGLRRLLEENRTAPIYLRDAPHHDRFFKVLGVVKKSIGMDPALAAAATDRLVTVDGEHEIAPDIVLTTRMATHHPRPTGNRYLWESTGDGLRPDPFDHELSMVVLDDMEMVVITGCSHNGVLNMVDGAGEVFPDRSVRAVVGGFHLTGLPLVNLGGADQQQIQALGHGLASRCSGPIVTGHCTGHKATTLLQQTLGDRLQQLNVGSTFEL